MPSDLPRCSRTMTPLSQFLSSLGWGGRDRGGSRTLALVLISQTDQVDRKHLTPLAGCGRLGCQVTKAMTTGFS